MIKLYSKLENNEFSGILVKKGLNTLTDEKFEILKHDSGFYQAMYNGFIDVTEDNPVAAPEPIPAPVENNDPPQPVDFNKMNYQQLLKYCKQNGIQVSSNKKADLLAAIQKNV